MLPLVILSIYICGIDAVIYDSYSGNPSTKNQIKLFEERNNAQYCLIDVKPCVEDEWRRIDASCTNLKYPSRGMARTPTKRLLTPEFSPNYEPRKTIDNKELPMSRFTRTEMLQEGKATDLEHTQLLAFYLLFYVNDVNSIHDILNYVFNTTNCCTPEGKSNYICAAPKIPEDDPYHRFAGVRCQNLTRPQSFQYFGCADFGTTDFARIVYGTPVYDLSIVYGTSPIKDKIRTLSKGLIKMDIDNGKEFPPANPNTNPFINKCLLNRLPEEKRCHLHLSNGVLGSNVVMILFYRQHNYIAKHLAQLNPCWSDDRIFYTARDINIAIYNQITYCEMLPTIFGKDNINKDGLSCIEGFRDMYDDTIVPQMSDEFIYVHRWFHTIQEVDLKLYDDDGNYLNKVSVLNYTARTGWLAIDNNLNKIYQGSFRQYGGKADHTIHPSMVQNILYLAQFAFDVATADLEKGRLFGFAPYVKYREFCTGKPYPTFDSLSDVMSEERIYRLAQIYENVEDVDLMTGIWGEERMPGSMVPYTVHCLMVEQLKRSIKFDRHWYERPNRPHAFTLEQLKAIRKATIAGVICANADGVKKIQPNAFNAISSENPLTDCSSSKMGNVDFSAWQDPQCKI